MDLLSFIEKDYHILEFINDVWEWQESYDDSCIKYLKKVPKKYIEKYLKEGTIYRGMVVNLDNVCNSDICSWTTDIQYANFFSENEVYFNAIAEEYDEIYKVVYKKTGKYIDFSGIIKDLESWMVDNEDYILREMDKTVDELFDRFYSEDEVLSDFNVDEIDIYSQDMVSVA